MKKIRKFLPVSFYDIPGIENWLEEQANAGLFPVSIRGWVTFTSTGIPGTRFRLAVKEKYQEVPDLALLELCRNSEWNYGFPIAKMYFLFYTTAAHEEELFPDYEHRGFSIDLLKKQSTTIRRMKWIYRILLGLLLLMLIWNLFFMKTKFDIQPDPFAKLPLLLLELLQPYMLMVFACGFFIWKSNRRDEKTLRSMLNALEAGASAPQSPGASRRIARESLAMVILGCLMIFSLFPRTFDGLNPWIHIPLERFHRPFPELQAMETETLFSWEELFGENPVYNKIQNTGDIRCSILAPTWYSVSQDGYSSQKVTAAESLSSYSEDEGYRYSPSLDLTYFQLLIPALARPVAESQMNAYRLVNLQWNYEDLAVEHLDFAVLASEPGNTWKMLALGKDNQVAVYRYKGRENLREHLELLAEIVR